MSNQNPIFIPGPTNIPDRLRLAMQVQTQDHRAPDFVETFAPVLEDTKQVFESTDGTIITFPASGTGGWEAAVTNTLSPGDKVLVARYGMFSHKWIDLCQRHGLDVHVVECPWGSGAPADKFEAILSADKTHQIKAVLTTHNENCNRRSLGHRSGARCHGRREPPRVVVGRCGQLAGLDGIQV